MKRNLPMSAPDRTAQIRCSCGVVAGQLEPGQQLQLRGGKVRIFPCPACRKQIQVRVAARSPNV